MKKFSGRTLSKQFEKQGVEIHSKICDTLEGVAEPNTKLWLPTRVLESVSVASQLTHTEAQLADAVIYETVSIARDTPARTLVGIINDSITRWQPGVPTPKLAEVPPGTKDSCPKAES